MSQSMMWFTIIVIGILTFCIRFSFIGFTGKIHISAFLERALRFVPVAALSALIFPDLFLIQGHFNISLGNARLIAGILAILVAWRTKNILLTIAVGMVSLWILQAWFIK